MRPGDLLVMLVGHTPSAAEPPRIEPGNQRRIFVDEVRSPDYKERVRLWNPCPSDHERVLLQFGQREMGSQIDQASTEPFTNAAAWRQPAQAERA